MEELREAAQYYFETAPERYKQRASRALDSGESFEEFYLRETERSIRTCNVCTTRLLSFYFCCTECEFYKQNYSLCVRCFYGGRFQHNHDSFADNHSVLTMHNKGTRHPPCVIEKKPTGKSFQQPLPPVQQTKELKTKGKGVQQLQLPVQETKELEKGKGKQDLQIAAVTKILGGKIMMPKEGMEKLADIAEAHYNAAPQNIRNAADEFFWSMVKQGNSSVTLDDFLKAMNDKGYPEYGKPEFFQLLVKDGSQVLNMSEVRTLYYILLSGRPFCKFCGNFIPDIFFCCSKCSASTYALCLDCYKLKAYVNHAHYRNDDVYFLDYTVLHTGINASAAPNPQSRSSKAIVKGDKREIVLTTFQATLNACTAALNFAAAFCTIM